jgi:hypothetical protein
MRRLTNVLASGFVTLAFTPAALAAGDPGMVEKDKALAQSAQTRIWQSRPAPKLTTLRYDMPSRGASLATPTHESIAQGKIQVTPNDRSTMQVRDKNELRYHYAAGSSLALSARSHHFGFGWRTRF